MDIKTYEMELKPSVQYHATNGACMGMGVLGVIHFFPGMGGASLFTMITLPAMGGIFGAGYGGYRYGCYCYDGLSHELKEMLNPPPKPTYLQEMGNILLRVPQLTLSGGMFAANCTRRFFGFFDRQKT